MEIEYDSKEAKDIPSLPLAKGHTTHDRFYVWEFVLPSLLKCVCSRASRTPQSRLWITEFVLRRLVIGRWGAREQIHLTVGTPEPCTGTCDCVSLALSPSSYYPRLTLCCPRQKRPSMKTTIVLYMHTPLHRKVARAFMHDLGLPTVQI